MCRSVSVYILFKINRMENEMENKDTLADRISTPIENLFFSIGDMYFKKGIGYVKVLAIVGSVLPIFLGIFGDHVGVFALMISFVLILLAMKRVDAMSGAKKTRSYRYMWGSFVSLVILGIVYLSSLANLLDSSYYSLGSILSEYFFQVAIAIVMALISTIYFYKSYAEVSKATNINLFKIAAILMILGTFISSFSSLLSSILIIVSSVFIIIAWISVRKIGLYEVDKLMKEE